MIEWFFLPPLLFPKSAKDDSSSFLPPLTFSILGDDEDQDDDDDGWRDGGEGGGIDHRRPNAARFPISREEKEAKKCNFFLFGTSFPVWPVDKDTSSLPTNERFRAK